MVYSSRHHVDWLESDWRVVHGLNWVNATKLSPNECQTFNENRILDNATY